MTNDPSSCKQPKAFHGIRRCILTTLYHYFRKVPYAAIELAQIAEDCQVDAAELNWNIVYLEKSEFVELAKSHDAPPFVSPCAVISAKGIDLVEDADQFNARFPEYT